MCRSVFIDRAAFYRVPDYRKSKHAKCPHSYQSTNEYPDWGNGDECEQVPDGLLRALLEGAERGEKQNCNGERKDMNERIVLCEASRDIAASGSRKK